MQGGIYIIGHRRIPIGLEKKKSGERGLICINAIKKNSWLSLQCAYVGSDSVLTRASWVQTRRIRTALCFDAAKSCTCVYLLGPGDRARRKGRVRRRSWVRDSASGGDSAGLPR